MAGAAIFISYRRGDAAGSARALYLVLRGWFGEDQVFFDQGGLRPGDVFPERLRSAIAQARVTLAVMGPGWLDELNRRHRESPAETDFVREELKLALALQAQHGEHRRVVPVPVECEGMPDAAQLADALNPELAALWQHDAYPLGGKQRRWDDDVRALLRFLGGFLQQVPLPTAADAARIAGVQRAVGGLLEPPSMQPLQQHWGTDPLAGFTMQALEDTVVAYAQAIDAAVPDWRRRRLNAEQLLEVRQACRDILSHLYGLAIDGPAARAWLEEPDGRRPVPVASIGALAFGYAAVHGRKAQIADSVADRAGFEPLDAVDLGAPDPGGTARRRAMLHRRFWQATYTDPRVEYPRAGAPLEGDELQTLKRRLAARARIHKRTHIVSEVHPVAGTESDLQQIADELGIVALPRTGEDRGLLRVDERDFNALVAETLACIQKIQ